MIEKPIFWDYLIFDKEEGSILGIKEDAPQDVKKAYEEHLKLKRKGIKV